MGTYGFINYENPNLGGQYKVHPGPIQTLEKIALENRRILNTHEILKARFESYDEDQEIEDTWRKVSFFYSCDAAVYHPDGRIKFQRNAGHLLNFTSKTSLYRGYIKASEEEFEAIDGLETNLNDLLEKYTDLFTGEGFDSCLLQIPLNQAHEDSILRYLAQDDALLREELSEMQKIAYFGDDDSGKSRDPYVGLHLPKPRRRIILAPVRPGPDQNWHVASLPLKGSWRFVSLPRGS